MNPVVVAPSYNNAGTLADVLTRVAAQGLPILLVNDGCTDATDDVFAAWCRAHPRAHVRMLRHHHNRGKAAALKTGFQAAIEARYTHALTIDTDGQHDPELIPRLLDAANRQPLAYVLGVRNDRHADYPARSRLGRRLSNLFIRLECGVKVADSQCGMRIYPLDLIRTVRCRAGRFGYEAEMITRAAWAGCPITEVPVNTRYLPPGQRVSHFNPWLDSFLGVLTHLRLLGREMSPVPHRLYHPGELPPRRRVTAREILSWLNPLRAWRELRRGDVGQSELAAALAVGVFVANLPFYGLQTAICLYLARRLHLNPLAVVAGCQVSTPPFGALLIAAALIVGHFVLHGSLLAWPDFRSAHAIWHAFAWPALFDWAVGGVLVGLVLALVVFAIVTWRFGGEPAEPQLPPSDGAAPSHHATHAVRETASSQG
jgi:uncharacterized protein (DUF2062 family)